MLVEYSFSPELHWNNEVVASAILSKYSIGVPGANLMTVNPISHATHKYTELLMIIARSVPLGIAICGSY